MAVNSKKTVQKGKLVTGVIVGLIVLIMFGQIFMVHALAADSDGDGISDATELDLANQYLPNLQFKAGEKFFPVEIGYHLSNSVLKKGFDENNTVNPSPTIALISNCSDEHCFLANKLANLSAIADDYKSKIDTLGYTVYARITKESEFTVVQYWFFYAYNDAPLNDHEGDWEMIEIVLDSGQPVWVAYSQHLKGQRASWGDVDKVDSTHPVVYVARGSHANYFRPYQGRLGLESDQVGADGLVLKPSNLTLVLLGEMGFGNHTSSQDWLSFGGRWGNWANLADAGVGFAGPFGPGQGDNSYKWSSPASWGQVEVSEVNNLWFALSWVAANFLLIFIGITVLLSVWKVWKVVRLRKTGGLRLPALLKTRASIGVALGIVSLVLTFAGMLLPWYMVKANVQTTVISTQGEADLLVMDGQRGLLVNFLIGNRDPSPVFSLQIPFGILLLVGIVFGILDIVGMKTGKDLGNKCLRGGLWFLIMFILLIVLIFGLTAAIQSLAASFGLALPPEATQIAQTVARQPLQGTQTTAVGDYGSVALSWGLGLGAYLLLVAAIIKLVATVVLRGVKEPKPQIVATQPPPPPPL